MLTEIIRELTKAEESADITSEQVLGWAKRVEAQRAQSAIMDSLTETKEFDKINLAKVAFKYSWRNVQTSAKVPAKKSCIHCSSAIYQDNAWPMGRSAWAVVRTITSERYTEAGEVLLTIV